MDAVQFEQSSQTQAHKNIRVRQYDPGQSSYSSRIPEREWERIRPTIENLHRMGTTRAEILGLLKEIHKFSPSYNQLGARMIVWGYKPSRAARQTISANHQSVHSSSSPQPMEWESTASNKDQANHVLQEQESSVLINSMMNKVFNPFIIEDYLDLSDQFCILHDIADFLAHSAWASTHCPLLSLSLMDFLENKHFVTKNAACLLLSRDFLRWSAKWADRSQSTRILRRMEHVLDNVDMSQNHNVTSISQLPSYPSSVVCPRTDLMIAGGTSHETGRSLCAERCYCSSPIEGEMLCSKALVLGVESSLKDEVSSLTRWATECLFWWCRQRMENFDLCFDDAGIRRLHPSEHLLSYCCARLTDYLTREWIEYTEIIPLLQSSAIQRNPGIRSKLDFMSFKFVARALALIASVILQQAKLRLVAVDISGDETTASAITATSIIRTATTELQLTTHDLTTLFHRPHPWLECNNDVNDLNDHVLDLTVTVGKEFHRLRMEDFSWRHRVALERLYTQVQEATGCETPCGLAETLCSYQSTPSLESFRLTGLRPRDERSRLKGAHNSFARTESFETLQSDWTFLDFLAEDQSLFLNCRVASSYNLQGLTRNFSETWTDISV